jgi:hypothetical protein
MSRYATEFGGLPNVGEPRGMDPNYRGGYGGMRMGSGYGRAAYGEHRFLRSGDLESAGGFYGIHSGSGADYRHPQERGAYDRGWSERGGVRDSYRDERLIRDFNDRSRAVARRTSSAPEREWSQRRD